MRTDGDDGVNLTQLDAVPGRQFVKHARGIKTALARTPDQYW